MIEAFLYSYDFKIFYIFTNLVYQTKFNFMINLLRLAGIRSKKAKIILSAVMFVLIVTGAVLFKLYSDIFSANVNLKGKEKTFLYIPSHSTMEDVLSIIKINAFVDNPSSLQWVMEKKNYHHHVHAGRYELKDGMCNNDLVDLLRSGEQIPVRLTFNNTRTLEEFCGKIAHQIEADSLELLNYVRDDQSIEALGFNQANIISLFIPNTYEVNWNLNAKAFVQRMQKEYHRFWNNSRRDKAKEIGLTPQEVSTLAAIVDEETIKKDEKPRVAGVYMNRLKRRIKLDADPTLKFALGDFTIKRVLNKHKKIDSKYNTYKYRGLPPGPIRQASISGIDAVLNYEKHRYIYFCANPDFSGYHVFARTLRKHNQNARNYQRALNRKGIMK